jgi:hypothetical protein
MSIKYLCSKTCFLSAASFAQILLQSLLPATIVSQRKRISLVFSLKYAGELHIIALIEEGTVQHKPTHTHTKKRLHSCLCEAKSIELNPQQGTSSQQLDH